MAATTALADVLDHFTSSATSSTQHLPEYDSLLPPEHGITLLDAKTEILLSYLQALALRNLNVVRSLKQGSVFESVQKLSDELTRKLVEHRVYLERGVRPLEQRIKYQVDKVIKAADDEVRTAEQKLRTNGHAKLAKNQDSGDSGSEDESESQGGEDIDELSYRPNIAAFTASKSGEPETVRKQKIKEGGAYRPPRISATTMPTTETRERKERGPRRSAMLDEYVTSELSTAPMAEPSIGSTITAGGRQVKNAKQLAQEQEKRDYEEMHLVRLPKESKKERAKTSARQKGGFGGEEWRGLGDTVDLIGSLTKRKGKESALDKSRKRTFTEDGPRGDGVAGAFEMKKRRMEKKSRR